MVSLHFRPLVETLSVGEAYRPLGAASHLCDRFSGYKRCITFVLIRLQNIAGHALGVTVREILAQENPVNGVRCDLFDRFGEIVHRIRMEQAQLARGLRCSAGKIVTQILPFPVFAHHGGKVTHRNHEKQFQPCLVNKKYQIGENIFFRDMGLPRSIDDDGIRTSPL